MSNITRGFIKTGIYRLSSKLFSDDEFLRSYVDGPDPDLLVDATPENLILTTPEFSTSHNDTSDAPRSPNVQHTRTDSLIKNNICHYV
ncbi:hypothetical protein JTB14_033894 [Gonioctena quinquepunctata]|nr:hypothetical protein JTB14_033894 [Gonioctena quinquepunctata]